MKVFWYSLLFILVASVVLGIVLIERSVGRAELSERMGLEIIKKGESSFADLLQLCDNYPSTDAGSRLVASTAICIGLAAHYDEFKHARPNELEGMVMVALTADEAAFLKEESAAITEAKAKLRVLKDR